MRYYVEQGKRPFFFTRERTEEEKLEYPVNSSEELNPGVRWAGPALPQALGGRDRLGRHPRQPLPR